MTNKYYILNSKKIELIDLIKTNQCSIFKFLLITATFFLFSTRISAQNVVVTSKLDTNKIIIGDQIKLYLKAQAGTGTKVKFPMLVDTIRDKIEIVNQTKIDTSYSPDKQRYELTKTFTITSFDSGYFAIAPFNFYVDDDSINAISTSALLLTVQTLSVDTTKAFRDIKGPLNAPLTFDEILPYLIVAIAILFIIVGIIIYLKKRKKVAPIIYSIPKVIIPPHLEALESLQKLKDEKLWQNGFEKEYHIRLSDIVRTYIEKRFGLTALEQTTDEIIRHTRTLEIIDEALRNKLRQILMLSDMVKFAKELPLPNENELSMEYAFEFIHKTTLVQKVEDNKLESI
jgi:hypothetical protein